VSNTIVVPRASTLVFVVAAVIGAAALAVDRPEAAVVAALALVGLLAALTAPALVLSLPLPLAYAYWRVGPESFDMSVADASLLAATIVALPYVPWRDRRLQRVLWVVIAYELMLVVPLAAHPTGPAVFEWFHRAVLVGGSVLVGAALVRLASLRFALRAFAAASAAVAIVSIVFTLTNDLDPAYPLGLQKNAAGNILAIAVLMGLVTPQLLGLRRWLHVLLEAVLIGGLLSVQSRGSMLAIIVCLCLWALRGRTHRPSMAVTMVLLIAAFAATVSLVNEREYERVLTDPNAAEFSPDRVRRLGYEAALDQWRSEPLTGAGLRYFNTDDASGGEPHNLAILALAEGGLFALAGVIVLLGGTYAVLARVRGPVATIARLAVLVRVLTGTVDVFWVAGRMTVPFVLVGAAIALEAERSRDEAARLVPARA